MCSGFFCLHVSVFSKYLESRQPQETKTGIIRVMNKFKRFHPLFVEGMSGYDLRDPEPVALDVVRALRKHWDTRPPSKAVLLIIQGDPLTEKGVSAITPRVASALGVQRGLIALDEEIADYHLLNADRDNVVLETLFSEVVHWLESYSPGTLMQIETAIDALIRDKNCNRSALGKPPLADYFPAFVRLQEVSKVALSALCGEMTLVHTSAQLVPSSVSSFYTVGIGLGLIDPSDIVALEDH